MSREKLLNPVAISFQRFQFGSYVISSVLVPSLIQRNNSNMVPPDQIDVFFHIIEGKGVDTI